MNNNIYANLSNFYVSSHVGITKSYEQIFLNRQSKVNLLPGIGDIYNLETLTFISHPEQFVKSSGLSGSVPNVRLGNL